MCYCVCSPLFPHLTCTLEVIVLLLVHLYVFGLFGLSAPRAPSNFLSACSLTKRAAWCVSFSLGVAMIWQRPGLHPMQETHPSEAAGCQSVCVCVCFYSLPTGPFSTNRRSSYTDVFAVLCQPVYFPPELSRFAAQGHCWCFLVDFVFSFHSHCTYPHFVAPIDLCCALLECPLTVPQNCRPNVLSEICPREAAASVYSKM